jgi:hypothetical protein
MIFAEGECFGASASSLSQIFVPFEAVLSIRTWAIWRRNKTVGIVLAVLTVVNAVAQCILAEKFIRSMICTPVMLYFMSFCHNACTVAPAPYLGFRGCFITGVSRILGANYASLAVVQAGKP